MGKVIVLLLTILVAGCAPTPKGVTWPTTRDYMARNDCVMTRLGCEPSCMAYWL
jgi:hypothetical protein